MQRLTTKQSLFVDAYCGPADFNATKAYKLAGYTGTSPGKQASILLNKPQVAHAIQERLDKRRASFWLTEDDILRAIHKEATYHGRGASHATRVNAWVQLGKHIGMFHEKKEEKEDNYTINITNYNQVPQEEVKVYEHEEKEEVLKVIPELKVINFNE